MIAIIPARSGSKRLPNKNSLELNGVPLIAYSIIAAKKSKYITRVFVNTDDLNIANIAIKYGAEVPFLRPKSLSTDTATTIDVLKHNLDWLRDNYKIIADEIILLQPTSPLRNEFHINEAIELYNKLNPDSLVSFSDELHPIIWHKQIKEDLSVIDLWDNNSEFVKNYKKTYCPNGAIFILKRNIIEEGRTININTKAYIMDRRSSIDIDTIEDFKYAEYILKFNSK